MQIQVGSLEVEEYPRTVYIRQHELLEHLNSDHERTRVYWSSAQFEVLDPELMRQGLSDPCWEVRRNFVRKWNVHGHGMDVAFMGLDDPHPEVREEWAHKLLEDYRLHEALSPYKVQGASDSCVGVAYVWIKNYDDFPSKMIEAGLQNPDRSLRFLWSQKRFTPTAEQVERGLSDPDASIRYIWAKRHDYIPLPHQIQRGLLDTDHNVREVWEKKAVESLYHKTLDTSEMEETILSI